MASSSSSRALGNLSKEADNLLHKQSEQLPTLGWDVFLSHSGAQKGFVEKLFKRLFPPYNVFFDITRPSLPLGERFPLHIFHAVKTCKVAVVVLSNEFLCSKWPMLELVAFFDAGVKVFPLFYKLSPQDLSDKEMLQEWVKKWEEFASKDVRIEVSSWARARQRLCSTNGLDFKKSKDKQAYLDEIVSAIYQMIPPLFRSSHAGVYGRDHLCKVFIDKFEKLKQRPQVSCVDLRRVYLLGVYGFLGSGKTTLCACLRDHFLSSFSGKALHLKIPIDPTPSELLGIAKQLLKLTNLAHNREEMISEIEDLSQMYSILEVSNLQSLRVFLVIDNISSQESIELVEAILRLGVGAESQVMLVARTREILRPLLNFLGNPHKHMHYVCGSMRVPSMNETEAICLLMQSASGLGLASSYNQNMEEQYNPIHRGILAKIACMCASGNQSQGDLLYLPLALKTIGPLLRSYGVDLDIQLSRLDAIMKDLKEVAVMKIVEESYKKLPKKLKLLFLDVALFIVPYCQFPKKKESAVELLGFMHECRPEAILRELYDLMKRCFLESGSEFGVHDVFLEFAKSVPDASNYYCRRRNIADLQGVALDLLMMAHRSTEGLRALILELDEKCENFDFPASLSSVKVVVIRQSKSLEVLRLAGLKSLVS